VAASNAGSVIETRYGVGREPWTVEVTAPGEICIDSTCPARA
jgi:hypothetical protein